MQTLTKTYSLTIWTPLFCLSMFEPCTSDQWLNWQVVWRKGFPKNCAWLRITIHRAHFAGPRTLVWRMPVALITHVTR